MASPLRARRLFVALSRLMAPGIRHGVIRSTRIGGSLCVLRTRGRRTGRIREAALDYAPGPGDEIWVAAGWGDATAWYANLRADPRVEVVLEGRTRAGMAETVVDEATRVRAIRSILAASGVVARLYGYDPATVTEERLAADFATTPIVDIRFDSPKPA